MIQYEYPFNERIRTYLRLEHLFGHYAELSVRDTPVDHHYALYSLFEILEITSRSDLKKEIMLDLDRLRHQLAGWRDNPAVAQGTLDRLMREADVCFRLLEHMPGKIGYSITSNDWLMALRSRIAIPGGTCEFDLPAYHAWQHLPETRRKTDLKHWMAGMHPVSDSIRLLLSLVRNGGHTQRMTAQNGQFQLNLPQSRSFQLLQLAVDPVHQVIPEISANRLLVSVRMMRQDPDGHLALHPIDVSFELTLCA